MRARLWPFRPFVALLAALLAFVLVVESGPRIGSMRRAFGDTPSLTNYFAAWYSTAGRTAASAAGYQALNCDSKGNLNVLSSAGSSIATDTVWNSGVLNSNVLGSLVTVQAASGTKTIYIKLIKVWNTDTIYHQFFIVSSSATGTTLYPFYVAPSGADGVEMADGTIQNTAGDSVQYYIDGSGSATSCRLLAAGVQK